MSQIKLHNIILLGKSIGVILLLAFINIKALEISITGAEFFSDRKIEDQLPLETDRLDADEKNSWKGNALYNIEEIYRKKGFFDLSVDITIKEDKQSVAARQKSKQMNYLIHVAIHEGKRYVFDKITLQFPDSVSRAARAKILKEDLEARKGEPYDKQAVLKSHRNIDRTYGNLGFVRVQVKYEELIHYDVKTVSLIFHTNPNNPVIFDTLIIHNNRPEPMSSLPAITSNEIIRNLVSYKNGDTVTLGENDKFIQKLQSTGLYNFVRLEDKLLINEKSQIILTMQERVPGNIRTSIYYETTYGPGATFDFSFSNVFGSMNEIRASMDFSLHRQNFKMGFGSPLPFGYRLRFDNDFEVEWNQSTLAYGKYGLNPGFFEGDFIVKNSSRISRSFYYWLRGVSEIEVERLVRLIYPDIDTTVVKKINEAGSNLNFISTGFITFLDHLMDPTRGTRYALTWGNGGDFWVDDKLSYERHNWLEIRTAYYYPLLRRLVGAVSLNAGYFFGEGGTNSQRFFLGGPRNIRSYAYHQICPTQICGGIGIEPVYYSISVETRAAVFDFRAFSSPLKRLKLVPFFDYGYVRDMLSSSSNAGAALGIGFRYPLFQVFNLRLDLAWGNPERGRLILSNRHAYLPDTWVMDLAQAF